jgi:hypothetical protein
MSHRRRFALLALFLLAGCADPNSVLFVTASSIGIDVDTKPPTASIAYHRVEGYIGPTYQNGGLPAAVASLQTGGTVFDPRIRQVYATGAAANNAVGEPLPPGPGAANGQQPVEPPPELSGDPKQKRLAFFGSTTTLGLKVSFENGGYPDSLTLGYKRKELSFLPVASTARPDGTTVDVYPSVLASIDTTTTAISLHGTGLTSEQFIATGRAAETLARNPKITSAFQAIAADAAVMNLLTPEQRAQVAVAVQQQLTDNQSKLDQIVTAVSENGKIQKDKLASLVDAANAKSAKSVPDYLKNVATADELVKRIGDNQAIVLSLFNALPPHT